MVLQPDAYILVVAQGSVSEGLANSYIVRAARLPCLRYNLERSRRPWGRWSREGQRDSRVAWAVGAANSRGAELLEQSAVQL